METKPTTSRSLETYYHINGNTFEKPYKEQLSGFRTWVEFSHADEWLVYPDNLGESICIDETSISDGELYTLFRTLSLFHPHKLQLGSFVWLMGTKKAYSVNYMS